MKKYALFASVGLLLISTTQGQTPIKMSEKGFAATVARKQDKDVAALLRNPPEMVLVEGGNFLMGSEDGEPEEQPIHKVSVSSFYIGKYEVTVAQYREFCKETGRAMPETPKWGWQDTAPIVNVSWNDANAYCKWLTQKTGQPYRLPTEAEWEFAARGGNKTKKFRFAGSNNLDEVGWFDKNSNKRTQPVGEKMPNELGLYDMSGNVWEWVQDWFDSDYYSKSPEKDPPGPSRGSMRVMRSGSWINYEEDNRIAIRISNMPHDTGPFFGFRVALSAAKN
ncbi:MAG: formylglycine-generating enzyme family protein [Cytophagales bacterium]|nr:formylglycine-generating enzyme family protein [Bernardetiaceae bacterium]MDW8205516.1 formylglycine-generating enzyme family protein [Cytophagales bacterium]